ncbi:AraC family transcriptional regulator [Usitatibacter palustris]|uniref:HTH araC/xylS-type domain-containing protein n=1 Tax=Usitatibacter palustris TaxID=2732487 RepID=A0A6M4HA95_9PROT|nr:AraC family transcriptional regulator [Usitatibacter palustris]QJR15778.1 hypothetical protein DSM104440_02604 [Usitatibacter palustris]
MLTREPGARLRPWVRTLWATEAADSIPGAATRERVLPTAEMHLVIRVSDTPLRIFDGIDDEVGHSTSAGVLGGIRAQAHLRDVSQPVSAVGAMLRPGACEALFAVPADELTGRHTPLDALWGSAFAPFRAQLQDAQGLAERLDVFERLLAQRLPRIRGLHPAVAHALERFAFAPRVTEVVKETGYSHRRFIALFRRTVGVAPKDHLRLQRFQRVLEQLKNDPGIAWADLAQAAGYSDQPHFNREFREFAGITPEGWRAARPEHPHHVPVNSLQDAPRRAR